MRASQTGSEFFCPSLWLMLLLLFVVAQRWTRTWRAAAAAACRPVGGRWSRAWRWPCWPSACSTSPPTRRRWPPPWPPTPPPPASTRASKRITPTPAMAAAVAAASRTKRERDRDRDVTIGQPCVCPETGWSDRTCCLDSTGRWGNLVEFWSKIGTNRFIIWSRRKISILVFFLLFLILFYWLVSSVNRIPSTTATKRCVDGIIIGFYRVFTGFRHLHRRVVRETMETILASDKKCSITT